MTRAPYGQWFLNVATVVVAALALAVGADRIRTSFFAPEHTGGAQPKTKRVENWRQLGDAGTRMGPTAAPVTIVEFSDFECPYCRVASGSLHELRRWYASDVAIVYRHLPIHEHAHAAAVASECAGRAGQFEAYHDALFAQVDSIGKKGWTRFALESGISDTAQFTLCLADSTVDALVRRDSLAAMQLGTHETPTFLINDLMVMGNPGFEQLNEYVKAALKATRR